MRASFFFFFHADAVLRAAHLFLEFRRLLFRSQRSRHAAAQLCRAGLSGGVSIMSAPDAVAAPPRKPRFNRWLAAGLIVSAAVNLAFIGWGAARYIHTSRMADRPPRGQIEEQITRPMPEPAHPALPPPPPTTPPVPRGPFL